LQVPVQVGAEALVAVHVGLSCPPFSPLQTQFAGTPATGKRGVELIIPEEQKFPLKEF